MSRAAWFVLLLLSTTFLVMAQEPAAERPATNDKDLKVTQGLALWLDAMTLVWAQKLKPDDSIAEWRDGSGQNRHLRQGEASRRPRLQREGESWYVRFDGVDDHLRATGLNEALNAFTAFVVAAPRDNPGEFRGFLALNGKEQRDYESGFTLDMSFAPSLQFDALNVEGRGFGGARSLLQKTVPFGTLQVLEAVANPQAKLVTLHVDGTKSGERPWQPAPLRMDEVTLGARFYTNGPGAQEVRGPLQGDIAEVLLYDRVLGNEESLQVRRYLLDKHKALKESLPRTLRVAGSQPIERIPNPPAVQMLVPGFAVEKLPVQLTNVNNLRYRADGKLVALAYNGNVYLLSDTNGDGLEDKAELFWDNQGKLLGPIGLALTPPNYPKGNGVFVPSKGKVSLIVDTNGDDRADQEIIVAEGWQPIAQAVDAVGVATDAEGNVYFGLGTANFANGYLVDDKGKSHFDIHSDRGTIQKVSPDFKKREKVCTGVRFPVSLAFHRSGDLFCTDQEGATWLPNGNPLDELLHLQPGRHYGFPPRHPKHLPNVLDEPSVVDYGPQHQSTCGMIFNESVNGGPTFGPKWWASDAIVCGESRGKLYRTKLVKTDNGYVGQNQIIACLQELTVDACVSPKGDLIVATHSGPPDWGTGPNGQGSLYRIRYVGQDVPQPVAIWAVGPQEVRISFDRPLQAEQLKDVAKGMKLTGGAYVRAGDQFEHLRPPYAVVVAQLRAPRFNVPIHGVQVASDQRTLIISTGVHREAMHYALTMPTIAASNNAAGIQQRPTIDLDYALQGIMASWEPASGGQRWEGWLPHLDLAVARTLTEQSGAHAALWSSMKGPGKLRLRVQLNLADVLRPAIQPGSTVDATLPLELGSATITSDTPLALGVDGTPPHVAKRSETGTFSVALATPLQDKRLIPMELEVDVTSTVPALTLSLHTNEDHRLRAVAGHRLLLPWARPADKGAEAVAKQDIPELKGGSWARGRKVFFSEEAACAKCHKVEGAGGVIGPDLSNLVHRDYASVLRDVIEPSYGINPDYVSHIVATKDGRLLTGALRSEGNDVLIGNEKGDVTKVARSDIERTQPSPKSIMPEDLPKQLGPEKMKDLLTFLLQGPPRMALVKQPPYPARTRAEVQAVLAGAPQPAIAMRKVNVVLVAGPKDHGPGEHDYPAWQKAWAELLAADDKTTVSTAWEWPSEEQLAKADVMVFYQHGTWNEKRAKAIDGYLERGGGLVYVHWAVDGNPDAPGFAQRIGLASRGGQIRFRHGPMELGFVTGNKHPIGRNLEKLTIHDESYWKLTGDPQRINLLAHSVEDGEPQPQFWTLEPSKGRVVVSIPGHFSWTFDDPLFRVLLLRSIAWAAREPVDRFNDLVWPGARVAE